MWYGEETVRHYDAACAVDARLNDVHFYLEVARAAGGRVLEVGCGTGRVLLPIARAGIPIDGLDFSPAMLAALRAKLGREAPQVQAKVALHEGDMRRFALGGTYDLITIPFRPLQHLHTIEDQQAAFGCFGAHLRRGGRIAFNVFYPNFLLLNEVGVEKVELEWTDPLDPSVTVRRFFRRKSVDKLHQFFDGEFIFRSYREGQLVLEERSELRMSYYTYPQLRLLLATAGFKVRDEYGSFARDPISVCQEMIFIAEKE